MAILNSTDLINRAKANILTIEDKETLELALKNRLINSGVASSSFDTVIPNLTTELDKVTNHPLITLSKAILNLSIEAIAQAVVYELQNADNPCISTTSGS